MLVLDKKQSRYKRIKGVNTTNLMDISHHAFSLHCIQIPAYVLVFDQFLSCCCSDPLSIEAFFEPCSWLEVLDILVVGKKMMHGWSFGLGEFPWKALQF